MYSAIELLSSNSLEIELSGAPDAFITLEITHASPLIFGPAQYVRTKGKPDVYTDSFNAAVGEGYLKIVNGDTEGNNRVSSVSVYLNGEDVTGPSDFNQNVYTIYKHVTLADANELMIELSGKPDTYISIEIFQQKTSVSFKCTPESISVGESAVLSWTSSSADTVSIDNGIGDVELNGSLTVSPTVTTTYTITAVGAGGTDSK